MKKFITQAEALDFAKDNPGRGEINEGDSLTIPNQSLTVREIITRFVSNEPLEPIGRQTYYDNLPEDDMSTDPTLDADFDLADAFNLKQEIAERKKKGREKKQDDAKPVEDEKVTNDSEAETIVTESDET